MSSSAQNSRQSLVLKGSATVPGLAFQGDNNTGVYSPGANEVAVVTNGTVALSVDASQTVALTNALPVGSGGTGLTSYTTGDILYASGAGTISKLPIGANGYVLTVNSGVPAWTAAAASGVASISFGSTGLTPSTATTGAITVSGTLAVANGGTGGTTQATARTGIGAAASGAVTGSGLTMATSRLLGRTTSATGAIEEISIGSGLTLSGGQLSASGSSGVTSISFGSTGLTPSTTTTGAVTVAGTLAVANGGTGATSASSARTNLGLGSSSSVTFGKVTVGSASLDFSSPYGLVNFTASTSIYGDTSSVVCQNSSSVFWTGSTGSFALGTGVQAYKDGGGSWIATSDSRVKKNVQNYVLSTSELLSLRPVSYQYNGEYGAPNNGVTYIGLIAQEVQQTAFSSMVGTYNYQGTELLNLDPSQLIYALINAVQELNARINALENKAP